MIRERENTALPGLPVAIGLITLAIVSGYGLVQGARAESFLAFASWAGVLLFTLFLMIGLFVVNPNEAKVLQFFGALRGHRQTAGPPMGEPALYQEADLAARSATSRART